MPMENCSFHEAANRLERGYADVQISSYADKPFSFHGASPSIKIQNIVPIAYPKLIAWVQERKIDLAAVNAMTERLEDTIREVRKTVKMEHCHKIEIASNWVFLSLVGMGLMMLGLSYSVSVRKDV
jgi:hypothetical protein